MEPKMQSAKGYLFLFAYSLVALGGISILASLNRPCALLEKRSAAQEAALASAKDICDAPGGQDDEARRAIFRKEPAFTDIYQPEYITLEFDLFETGIVNGATIEVLETSDTRLIAPAVLAIVNWQYCPLAERQNPEDNQTVKVRFTIQPPVQPTSLEDLILN